MIIGCAKIIIHVSWVHSLKEKRMIVKSLCAKVSNKFNVSIAEVENQDIHQSIGLGFACVTTDSSVADSMIDTVLNFIESNTEGEIMHIEREIL